MSHRISLGTTVKASRDQVSCNLADEVVILSLRNGGYFGLNPVAARVWEMLQEERLVIEIRDMLLREYAVEEEHCTRELVTLLEHFAEWKLIELGEEGVAM